MTPQINKRTQQPSPKNGHTMQSSSSSSASPSLTHPPGYRFEPTDAELIYYYLKTFSRDGSTKSWTNNPPIHQANIYESNPQQLSAEYKKGNLREWFFVSERTKIKRNGTNQKRVDQNGGYWHGKAVAKKIKAKDVVGYKTTLNYYVGKQPNGVKTNWLMQEYWLMASDHDNTVDYALCKIYLSPTARKNMNEDDDEDIEVEVENQQPQFYPTPTPLVSHQPQRQDNEYQEPLQAQPLKTIYHQQSQCHNIEYQEPHQPQPLDTIIPHQLQRQDNEYQEPLQAQPPDTIIPHQSQRQDSAYQEPHQPQPPLDTIIPHQSHQLQFWQATHGSHQTQPHDLAYHELQTLDTVQDQVPQFWPSPFDSYLPHCHDIQYPQPQPLHAIEYHYLYHSGPLINYQNMIESFTQAKSNGDSKTVDHALKIHLTPRGVKRKAEKEEDEKRKKKKEEGGVEASKEELEQPINSHQFDDDDGSFFTGFIDPHLLDIDIDAINSSCLKKSSDKD